MCFVAYCFNSPWACARPSRGSPQDPPCQLAGLRVIAQHLLLRFWLLLVLDFETVSFALLEAIPHFVSMHQSLAGAGLLLPAGRCKDSSLTYVAWVLPRLLQLV